MIEYHVLRVAVGILSACLAASIPSGFTRLYWALHAAWCLFPAFLWSEWWKQWVNVPCVILLAGLAIAATVDHLDEIRILCRERTLLILWGVLIGLIFVLMGWAWSPERLFQTIMIGRQYVLLALAVGVLCAWVYLRYLRPCESGTASLGWWGIWLLSCFLISTTTKGGLLWSVVPWHGGLNYWRAVSDTALAAQALLLLIRLRQETTLPSAGAQ